MSNSDILIIDIIASLGEVPEGLDPARFTPASDPAADDHAEEKP